MTAVSIRVPAAHASIRSWVARYVLGERLGLTLDVAEHDGARYELRAGAGMHAVPAVPPAHVLLEGPVEVDGTAVPAAAVTPDGVAWLDAIAAVLAGLDELARGGRDAHDRVPTEASWLARYGLAHVPLVDHWVRALGEQLEAAGLPVQPAASQPVLAVSHDVDMPFAARPPGPLRTARAFVRAGRGELGPTRSALAGVALATLGRAEADPLYTFDRLLDGHAAARRQATLFVLADAEHPRDARYRLADPEVQRLLGRWLDAGHRVGLHGGYATYDDAGELRRQADRLRATLRALGHANHELGGRQHYLRWRPEATPAAFVEAGLAYDASVGFADRAGFRRGTAWSYPAFDARADRALPLRVEPLVLMECSLYASRYRGFGWDSARARAEVDALRDACAEVGGTFSTLWHNAELVDAAAWRAYEHATG